MGTLVTSLLVILALLTLPALLIELGARLCVATGQCLNMIVRAIKWTVIAMLKVLRYIALTPVRIVRDICEASKVWFGLTKTGYTKAQKVHRTRQAVKNKKATETKNAKLDNVFYESRCKLKELKAINESIVKEVYELDSPTFMRQKIFQVDHNGNLLRDKEGNPIKTSIDSMFEALNQIVPEPSQAHQNTNETVIPVQSTQPTYIAPQANAGFEFPDSSSYFDDESWSEDNDPTII